MGLAVSATVTQGTSGKTTSVADNYGAGSSASGSSAYKAPNSSGPLPGAVCAPPILTTVKSANGMTSGTTTSSGLVVSYSVLVTNTGSGIATGVVAQDQLSPYVSWGVNSFGAGVAFQFVDAVSPHQSGLTLGTPVFSNDHGASWSYTPVSGGGGAPTDYDANVTNSKIPMTGIMNADGANFTLNYKVQVN